MAEAKGSEMMKRLQRMRKALQGASAVKEYGGEKHD